MAGFNINGILKGAAHSMTTWMRYIVLIIGLVIMGIGIFKLAKSFMNHGKGQTSWALAIICIFVGGALAIGGFKFLTKVASGGEQTLKDLDSATDTGTDVNINEDGKLQGAGTIVLPGSNAVVCFD